MLLPKFRRYGLTPAQEQRRDERALERVRKLLRMRRSSVRSVVSIPELVAALDAAEQAELPQEDSVERVAPEDRTLIGAIPVEYLREQGVILEDESQMSPLHLYLRGVDAAIRGEFPESGTDYQALMLVAEQAPLYRGDYVEEAADEGCLAPEGEPGIER